VDFPEPFSPIKKVSGTVNSMRSLRAKGKLNGYTVQSSTRSASIAICSRQIPVELSLRRALGIRKAYCDSAASASEATRERATFFLDEQLAHGKAWVAVQAGRLVSLAAFNAVLPDIVQLGGIYTPPAFRRLGYATIAVAASFVAARERGATRAVLFTGNPNAARCYEALGFRRIGDFALILLR